MKLNVHRDPIRTHEGAVAKHINAELQLRRSVMSCLLWEKEFYESGLTIADRIMSLIPHVSPEKCASIAVEARTQMKLRHAPLLIVREMARLPEHKKLVADTLSTIIQRADELAEFIAIYWKNGKQSLSAQVKKGLGKAFQKFDEYQLAKYDRDGVVKLRDVLFLVHAKPKQGVKSYTKEARRQGMPIPEEPGSQLYNKLVNKTLEPPDTWEVALSSGANKKETWERLIRERKLGAMALLRNLRNFIRDGVSDDIVREGLENIKAERVLPFRFISASKYAVKFEPEIEKAMLKCLSVHEKLPGHTVLLLDVSGSMNAKVSNKSEISRLEAACGVAILAREICESVDIFTFSMALKQIPIRHGFALSDAIVHSQSHDGTPLGLAIRSIYASRDFRQLRYDFGPWSPGQSVDYSGQNLSPDRLIIITDEQSCDPVPNPQGRGYMINVASAVNGVGYGPWVHIDGWSEAVIDYIQKFEESKLE